MIFVPNFPQLLNSYILKREKKEPILVGEFTRNIFWDGGNKNREINVDIDSDGIDETITIGRDHPNGTKILIINGEQAFNIGNMAEGLDDFGELNEGNYCQLAVKDVTNDGHPEIILAIGDGLIEGHLNIWQFDQETWNSSRKDQYINPVKLIFEIGGQSHFEVLSGGKIHIPYGSFGLFDEIIWNGKKFVETNLMEKKN